MPTMPTPKASNAFLGNTPLALSAFIGSNMVVQNYPQKYVRPETGKPRENDESYHEAQKQGFIYGIMADNTGQNWTRLIMVKPSDDLLEKWNEKVGMKIEAITFNNYAGDPNLVRINATYMSGVGSKTLGFMDAYEFKKLKQNAWIVEIGDAL